LTFQTFLHHLWIVNNCTISRTYAYFLDLAPKVQFVLFKEDHSKEDTLVQYIELVLKRGFASGWRQTLERVGRGFASGWRLTLEKVRLFYEKTSQVDPKEETEKLDWRDKLGKNSYY
jgi:hypothetical protein